MCSFSPTYPYRSSGAKWATPSIGGAGGGTFLVAGTTVPDRRERLRGTARVLSVSNGGSRPAVRGVRAEPLRGRLAWRGRGPTPPFERLRNGYATRMAALRASVSRPRPARSNPHRSTSIRLEPTPISSPWRNPASAHNGDTRSRPGSVATGTSAAARIGRNRRSWVRGPEWSPFVHAGLAVGRVGLPSSARFTPRLGEDAAPATPAARGASRRAPCRSAARGSRPRRDGGICPPRRPHR